MTEFFGEDVDADEWALPGDQEALAALDEAAATGEAQPVQEQAAETVDDRPRDELGRFAKAEEPEPESAADVQVVEPEQTERLLAGNFKTAEELERAYMEQRSLHDRQMQELGELRKVVANLDERLAAPSAAAPVQITTELIESNPGYATVLAYEQGNQNALAIAFGEWKEQDPAAAGAWAATETAKQQFAPQLAAYEAKLRELEEKVVPATHLSEQQQLRGMLMQAETSSPGLQSFIQSEDFDKVGIEFPGLVAQVANGSPDQKVEALTALHQIHRGRLADNLKVTQEAVAREQAQQAQAVREEAFVASASTTSAGVKPSLADQIAASWDEEDSMFTANWNV